MPSPAHRRGAALLLLWIFSIFWLFTTRTWRHFIPTITGMWGVLRFYSYGIFKGERHPYRKAYWRKHNPLQALAYLMLKIVLFPGHLDQPAWPICSTSPGAMSRMPRSG
jgi:thiosulfate reductase cytochrome b subunit